MDSAPSEYLDWVWEIPISPEVVSVGYTTTGTSVKAKREQGLSVDQILHEGLKRFPHLKELAKAQRHEPTNVTSFRSRAFTSAAGPNWMITGEAAAMVDPMTSNGVTAALRHAAEASRLILKHRKRGRLPWLARVCYSSRILQNGEIL